MLCSCGYQSVDLIRSYVLYDFDRSWNVNDNIVTISILLLFLCHRLCVRESVIRLIHDQSQAFLSIFKWIKNIWWWWWNRNRLCIIRQIDKTDSHRYFSFDTMISKTTTTTTHNRIYHSKMNDNFFFEQFAWFAFFGENVDMGSKICTQNTNTF